MLTTLRGTSVPEIGIKYIRTGVLENRVQITGITDSYKVLRETWDEDIIQLQEQFKVLYLNNANYVLGIYNHTIGNGTSVQIDPRLILGLALKMDTHNIILAHNHPSGCLRPSQQDIKLTERIKEAAALFSINILDHMILTHETYFSMADNCVRPFD